MLAIITMLALSHGAAMLQSDVTSNTRDSLSKAMFGEPLHECLKSTLSLENLADENDPDFIRLNREVNIYNLLFFIVQLGILYLGSALIVRAFNKRLKTKAEETRLV